MTSAMRTEQWLWFGHELLLLYLRVFRPRLHHRFNRFMVYKMLEKITSIDPINTPFVSSLTKTKSILHEWITDDLSPAEMGYHMLVDPASTINTENLSIRPGRIIGVDGPNDRT